MAFDFRTLVTDRTQQDVAYARQLAEKLVTGVATEKEKAEWNSFTLKGVYNYTDLNRVTTALEDLKLRLEGYGYSVPGYQRIKVPHPVTGGGSRLPDGYTQLKYIQSNGTQHIDMGLALNQNSKIVVDFQNESTSFKSLCGAQAAANTSSLLFYLNNSTVYPQYGNSKLEDYAIAITTTTRLVYELSASGAKVGNTSKSVSATTFSTGCNAMLFVVNIGGTLDSRKAVGKLYSCKVYDNGTLVRDFVPCVNPSGAVGLYDFVNKKFYGNNGTGAFGAGDVVEYSLPEGYTELDYIQSSGTQYVDTLFAPSANTRLKMHFEPTAAYSSIAGIFGVRDTNAANAPLMFILWNNGNSSFRSDYFGTQKTLNVSTLLAKHTVDKNKNLVTIDTVSAEHTTATGQCTKNLYLFCANAAGTAKYFSSYKLYSCQIYDNGICVRWYVPVVNESGSVGLYDVITRTFYGNAGTEAFTAPAPAPALALADVPSVNEFDPYLWYEFDWPTTQTMTMYLFNISAIRAVLSVMKSTPSVPVDTVGLTVQEANNIEKILEDIDFLLTNAAKAWFFSGEVFSGEV